MMLSALFFAVATLSFDKFGYVSSSQLMFHLLVPKNQINADSFIHELKLFLLLAFCSAIVAVMLFFLLFRSLKRWKISFFHNTVLALYCAAGLSLTISLFYFNDYLPLKSLLYFLDWKSDMIDKNFHDLPMEKVSFKEKRNCILLIAESLESTFAVPEAAGKNFIPRLDDLQKNNLFFDRRVQCNGTGWTIASLINIFYGIPQLPLYNGNEENGNNRRSFRLPSIYNYFLAAGYQCGYMQGGDIAFSGKNQLFINLPEVKVTGYTQLSQDPAYRAASKHFEWGVDDEILFANLQRECTRLANDERPFFLAVLTLDTHFPNGFLRDASKVGENEYFAEVLRLTDNRICDFVNWVKKQKFAENTTVIIVGDHLAMDNDMIKKLNAFNGSDQIAGKRKTYNCFINPTRMPVKSDNRIFTAFDLMPTILHAAGAEWGSDRLHCGVSLFGNTPTLMEKYGIGYYEKESLKKSDKYISILTTNSGRR